MQIKFSPPDITEAEVQEVADALRSGWITTGPRTKEFERRIAAYCHTEKAAALNSATAAMELSLRVMGIGEGDEVITTAYTYTATASCICHTGATPVLVDTLPDSFEMDPEKVRAAFTERTKAVICVDLAGIVYGHYDEIFEIAEEKKSLFRPANERQRALGLSLIHISRDRKLPPFCVRFGNLPYGVLNANGSDIVKRLDFFFLCSSRHGQRCVGRGACHADLHELCVLGVVDAQAENRGDHEGGEDDGQYGKKVSGAVGLHHSLFHALQSVFVSVSMHAGHLPKRPFRPQCG